MLDDALGQVDWVFRGIWGCGLDDGVWHGLLDLNEGLDGKAEDGSDVLGGDGLLACGGELGDGGGRVGGECAAEAEDGGRFIVGEPASGQVKGAGRTAGRTCRAAGSLCRARKSGRSRRSRLGMELRVRASAGGR